MKNLCFTLFLLAFGTIATAQSTFSISEDSLTNVLPSPETLVGATNKVTNLTSEPISIRWRRFEINLTPGCETQVCDPNQCYLPTVNSKIFVLAPDSSANMVVDLINETGEPASVIVRLQFNNMAQLTDTASAYYFLTVGASSGTEEQNASLRIALYPNPVTEFFTLEHADAVQTIRMYNTNGSQVAEFAATPGQRYSLAGQPVGTYFVALADKDGKVFRALQVVKK